MRKPGIFTEIRFDTADIQGVFRAVPQPDGSFQLDIRESFVKFTGADLACAAEFFARLAAEASKESARE